MEGLELKCWACSTDPAKHKGGRLVVLHGRNRFSPKFALEPAGKWVVDDLPTKSRLRLKRELGMVVSLVDVPIGRHLAVPVGVSQAGPTKFWMCPCGSRYIQHKETENNEYVSIAASQVLIFFL